MSSASSSFADGGLSRHRGGSVRGESRSLRSYQENKGAVTNFGSLISTGSVVADAMVLRRRNFTTPTAAGSAKSFASAVFTAGVNAVSDATIASADIVAAEWTAGTAFKVLDSVAGNDGIYRLQSVVNGTLTLTGQLTALAAGEVYFKDNVIAEGPITIRMEQLIIASYGFDASDNFFYDSGTGAGPLIAGTHIEVVNNLVANDAGGSLAAGAVSNVLLGTGTGATLATGDGNVAIGDGAFLVGTNNHNILLGTAAGATVTTAANCIGIGQNSLNGAATTGNDNYCIGRDTGVSLTAGTDNVCFGRQAGNLLATGNSNTFVGLQAGRDCNDNNNTGIGLGAMRTLTTGDSNVAVGRDAMGTGVVTGDANVAVGQNAGTALTSGTANTLLGRNAANTLTTGSGNVVIGDGAAVDAVGRANAVVLGSGITAAAADASFSVIHRTIAAGTACSFTGNELHADSSSERYKEDIVDYEPDLSKFSLLRPRNFAFKPGAESPLEPHRIYAGLIAEEVYDVFPEFVSFSKIDPSPSAPFVPGDYAYLQPESVMYAHLVTLLIKKVQDLEQRIPLPVP